MNATEFKVVYDCNIYLQAVANAVGPAGECVEAALQRRVTLYIDDLVITSVRDVAHRPEVARKMRLLPERVDELLVELSKVAISVRNVPAVFQYERDPDDAHYIDLALAAEASLVVSRDRDLLDLMDAASAVGLDFHARFPTIRILNPMAFLQELRQSRSS